ncbi:hypothetical protein ACX27_27385 [Nostoc piscinale CENA21]|uniref:Uncharacterized protein n=1 Tax=Nostoc piscinale CENA21 TaxID=224013 RepID=A0A0M4TY17_9NOSO|nr:hypothetical protein [Nostoc piscinale]ALF55731.1 hypothetical protein ACX27_27385 [Nostoc piscinale CENA21]
MQATETQLRKPKSSLFIQSIKIDHGDDFKLSIVQDLPPEDKETKKLTSKYTDEPKKSFFQALKILHQTVMARCGLDDELWVNGKITSITIKETEEGINITIVSCLEFGEETQCFIKLVEENISYELKERLANLEAEIEDYIKGDRAYNQQSLF